MIQAVADDNERKLLNLRKRMARIRVFDPACQSGTSFLQDKTALECGLVDMENTSPEELTQLRMGKLVRERHPSVTSG